MDIRVDLRGVKYQRALKIYLACPYSINGTTSPEIRQNNFEIATKVAAKLMLEGLVVFSPISHSHPIQTIGQLTTNSLDFWMMQDLPWVGESDIVVVLRLDGWEKSPGVKKEIEYAKSLSKVVLYADFENDEVKVYERSNDANERNMVYNIGQLH